VHACFLATFNINCVDKAKCIPQIIKDGLVIALMRLLFRKYFEESL